jgi:hypothetical protein
MSDWVRILISAVCGMFSGIVGGLLLEPLKQAISQRLAVNKVRGRIYHDLARIVHFARATDKAEPPKAAVLLISTTEAFDFYFENKREMFYMLPECQLLRNLCLGIRATRASLADDVITTPEALEQMFRQVNELYSARLIEAPTLDKALTSYRKRLKHQDLLGEEEQAKEKTAAA